MSDKPIIKAKIKFLSVKEGGRNNLPLFNEVGAYRPHLTMQDPSNRTKMVKADDPNEDYLGVAFLKGPLNVKPDEENIFELSLAYWPEIKYKNLVKDAFFAIREGDRIVGFGQVVERN